MHYKVRIASNDKQGRVKAQAFVYKDHELRWTERCTHPPDKICTYIHEYSCLRRTCMVYISLCYFMCVVRYQYLLINLPRECLISDSNLIPILSDCLTFTLYTVHWFAGYFYLVGSGPIYDHLFRYNNLRRVTYSFISNCSSSYTCTLSVGKVFSFKCQFSTKIFVWVSSCA